jgi:CDP-diacylglycerol--serine O-phosphatidyltransferase
MVLSVSVNFRKTYYILPNLFTLSSVFCGFISISLSSTAGVGNADLYQAALAICFGFFFDTADGRVARLTKTQTDLGRDLDSLADLVTFGVAPAMMVYRFGLTNFGRLGIFIAGLFVCAGALRLARFNVLSRREEAAGEKKPGKYTLGLTIPASASVLVLMVVVAHNIHPYRLVSEGVVAAVVLVLSYLMVSRVKFRSFKDLRLTRKTVELMLLIAGCWVVVAMNGVDKALIFLVLIVAYIVLGIAETVLLMQRKFVEQRQERRAQTEAAAAEAPRDEEVLRELGAFDGATTDES